MFWNIPGCKQHRVIQQLQYWCRCPEIHESLNMPVCILKSIFTISYRLYRTIDYIVYIPFLNVQSRCCPKLHVEFTFSAILFPFYLYNISYTVLYIVQFVHSTRKFHSTWKPRILARNCIKRFLASTFSQFSIFYWNTEFFTEIHLHTTSLLRLFYFNISRFFQ